MLFELLIINHMKQLKGFLKRTETKDIVVQHLVDEDFHPKCTLVIIKFESIELGKFNLEHQ